MNNEYSNIAKTYKRKVAGSFMLVDGAKMADKLSGEDFCVTKKLDGAMQIVFYRDGEAVAVSSNGNERTGLPCLKEFAQLAQQAGVNSLTVAAELYATLSETGRERVHDVATAMADEQLHDKLHLAPFDLLDIDGEPFAPEHYKDTIAKLNTMLDGTLVKPVESKAAASKHEVEDIYQQWVVNGGAEGLVVHSEQPIVYKVKPRHTIDAVIIGFTVGENDECNAVRDILVAVMREDGLLQQFGATGGGFSDAQKREFYDKLSAMATPSDYVETDSRNVAFQMVRPVVVVELSLLDAVSENSAGEPKVNKLLSYDPEKGYLAEGPTNGVAVHSMVFVQERPDKGCNPTDIRIAQLSDLCEFSVQKPISLARLPKSEQLVRRIFTKGAGEKLMIQKYVVWKTNKEESGIFPAYVFHYTDFSVGRKEQLKRDIRVSNSQEQIMQMLEQFIQDNVKKGWTEKMTE